MPSFRATGTDPLKDGGSGNFDKDRDNLHDIRIEIGAKLSQFTGGSGTTFYVANDGDDVNGDGTVDNPFQTIAVALTQCTANYGDSIALFAGTYDMPAIIDVDGITIFGLDGWQNVVINNAALTGSNTNITANAVSIENLWYEVPTTTSGITLSGDYNQIKNCYISLDQTAVVGASPGILITGDYNRVVDNKYRFKVNLAKAYIIGLDGADYCIIERNQLISEMGATANIRGVIEVGISVATEHNYILDNTIIVVNDGAGKAVSGISTTADATKTNIIRNTIVGDITDNISDSGSETVMSGNSSSSSINTGNMTEDDLVAIYDSIMREHTGNVYFISPTGSGSGSGSWYDPSDSLTNALVLCTADNDDVIVVMAGTYDDDPLAVGTDVNVAGVTIIGMHGAKLTNTNVGATHIMKVTADRVDISGVEFLYADIYAIECTGSYCKFHDMTVGIILDNGIYNQYTNIYSPDGSLSVDYAIEIANYGAKFENVNCATGSVGGIILKSTSDATVIKNCSTNGWFMASYGVYIESGSIYNIIDCKMVGFIENIVDENGKNWNLSIINGAGPNSNCISTDMPSLFECFESESLDATIWEEILDGVGTGAFATAVGIMQYDIDTEAVGDADVILNSKYRWQCAPSLFGYNGNSPLTKIVFEFMAKVKGTVTQIDNTNFFLGLSSAKSNDITTQNIAGFILIADALNCRTDSAGTDEDSAVSSPPTLTDWNRYRIDVLESEVRFYINDEFVANSTVSLPNVAQYLIFGTRAEGAASVGLSVANISVWYERKAI